MKREPDRAVRGQVIGDAERDAAGITGDDVRPTCPHPLLRQRWRQPHGVVAANPAVSAAERDLTIAPRCRSSRARLFSSRLRDDGVDGQSISMLVHETPGYSRGITVHGPSNRAFSGTTSSS